MPRRNIQPKQPSLSQFLDGYAQSDPARFHMPGHKGRGNALYRAAQWDITEIPGADNLLAPEGLLKTAQQEAAAFFGARATFFLSGGSSQGMQAALLALPADTLVFAHRDCHRSLISALALSGQEARFLPAPALASGLTAPPDVRDIAAALTAGGSASHRPRALVLTRPDYFGRCCDIAAIAALCRRERVLLVVDEAHGAHFPLSPALPDSALPYADIVFASAHKTLDAPNPAAYLHLGPNATIAPQALELAARLLGTTSPPYPLLAALDSAWRDQQPAWDEHVQRLALWRMTLPGTWQDALARGQADCPDADPSRLCFDLGAEGGGYALEAHLRAAGVYMEMADSRRVVGITSPLDPPDWYDRLAAGLSAYRPAGGGGIPAVAPGPPPLPARACTVRQALLQPCEPVAEQEAVGRICARSVGAYPPGSALLCPGERIDRAILSYLQDLRTEGATLFGLPFLCVQERK